MLKKFLLFSASALFAVSVHAQTSYAPYGGYYQPYQQKQKSSGFGEWKNWMQNQLNGRNWQQGDGNVFQDGRGFYKWMGNGKTKYKFYFDMDFQIEMDAWLKAQNKAQSRAKTKQRMQPNWRQQQYWNHQGQVAPDYRYRGRGYYQGYVYPNSAYQSYPYYPAQQR